MTSPVCEELEDLHRRLAEQDASLEHLAALAHDLPETVTVAEDAIAELDAVCSRATSTSPGAPLPLHGLRA